MARELTVSQKVIESAYQKAMNLRDSTWTTIDMEPIEREYQRQYMRAFRTTSNVIEFRMQTKEYRALLRAYKKDRLGERNGGKDV